MPRLSGILFIAALFSLVLTSAHAAPPRSGAATTGVKIGIVDMQKVLREAKAAKAARAAFEKELEAKRIQIANKEKEARDLEGEINRLDPTASLEVRRQKADKLKHVMRELNNLKQDTEEELKRKEMEMAQKILGEIMAVVRNYARNERLVAVFERGAVMVADEAIDITDRILKIYDGQKR